jgi:hypothetical protein
MLVFSRTVEIEASGRWSILRHRQPVPRVPALHSPPAQAQPRPPDAAEGSAEGRPDAGAARQGGHGQAQSPVGQKGEVPLRLVLPRAVLERLHARAQRESYPSLAPWCRGC